MPGVVSLATVAGGDVLPASLARAFTRIVNWDGQENLYASGISQRGALVTAPRGQWALTRRLTRTDAEALRTYWINHRCVTPFYFYDVFETSSFAYDVTGVSATGRHTVRFDNQTFPVVLNVGRLEIPFQLIEIA